MALANPSVNPIRSHAKTLKELLRSKFSAETWLTLCAEIQDVLRERKRDALAAYWLAQPRPADVPTGKWERWTKSCTNPEDCTRRLVSWQELISTSRLLEKLSRASATSGTGWVITPTVASVGP